MFRRIIAMTGTSLLALAALAPTAASADDGHGAARVLAELNTAGVRADGAPTAARPDTTITPQNVPAGWRRARAGLFVAPDALSHTDLALRTEKDGFSEYAVLRDAKASPDVTFAVDTAAGRLRSDGRGGIAVLRPNGSPAGRIAPPWARDARGRRLPTAYRIAGNRIVQHVDTSHAVFPVVADPHYTWHGVFFNRHETQVIATTPDWVDALHIPGSWGTLLKLYAVYISSVAKTANSFDLCVMVTLAGTAQIYGGADGDGYCQ
jgi:hypothetical protein